MHARICPRPYIEFLLFTVRRTAHQSDSGLLASQNTPQSFSPGPARHVLCSTSTFSHLWFIISDRLLHDGETSSSNIRHFRFSLPERLLQSAIPQPIKQSLFLVAHGVPAERLQRQLPLALAMVAPGFFVVEPPIRRALAVQRLPLGSLTGVCAQIHQVLYTAIQRQNRRAQ